MGAVALSNSGQQDVRSAKMGSLDVRMKKFLSECGSPSSLTYSVASMVVAGSYTHAIKEMEMYVSLKSEYPDFIKFSERLIEQCTGLIGEIEEKRNTPGKENMTMAKIQVINDSVMKIFDRLEHLLNKIEKIEYNQRMNDLRSTLIVVRTLSWCVLSIVILAFILEVYNGLATTTGSVADDMITEAVDWTFTKVGF